MTNAKKRIPNQTLAADFSDGDVLYGEDINKIINVLKEGINENKSDLNRILTGSDYFYIAEDLSSLTDLISELPPEEGQRGYVFNGEENEGSLEVYKYNDSEGKWEFLQSGLNLDGIFDMENANMLKDVVYNNVNGVLTFTRYDDTTKEIDLPLEFLVESGYYDEVTNELVLVLANSSEIRIPVENLLTDLDAHNIRFNGSGTNYLTTKTEVESAVKELDTRVKTNADDLVTVFQDKADKTALAVTNQNIVDLQNDKADKTTTIIGLDLQDNILIGEFRTALGNATQSVAGLLSAEDKTHLDGLVALLETSDGNNVVDTIGEILDIFQNYPEGANILEALNDKVNKIEGKGLSENDYTDIDKNKVNLSYTHSEIADGTNPHNTKFINIVDKPTTRDGYGITDVYTKTETYTQEEINSMLGGKQDKLVAGENITIDENNVISASGIDLSEMSYFDYAGSIYGDKYNLLVNAWEHSLTVDPLEISAISEYTNPRGIAQYPNGETEGVIIPQGVTSIGEAGFTDWSSNNQPLVIPNSVTSIGNDAFYGWTSNNKPLVIPDSVTSIGVYAFALWEANNQPLIIPNSVTNIEEAAFQSWTSNNQPLVIPSSVISIENYAFAGWTANNQPLVIPSSVISISDAAFYEWIANNQPLVIPNSVTSIGDSVFFKWSANNHPLVIPDSVTSIGVYAFAHWLLVPYVEIQAITPPTLSNSSAFNGQNDAPIYVPDESVDNYKTATNWVDLADRIFPISDKPISDKPISDEGDPNAMAYFNFAGSIYGDKYNLLVNAWEHSLTVDPLEISENSDYLNRRGTAQYPNGETEGVIIPQGVTSIGVNAFRTWYSNNQPLVIPNSITSIDKGAFQYWSSNNQPLVIPNSVTSIGVNAFANWHQNNQPLVIPNSITSIDESAFRDWEANNQPLVIPNSVTSIGDYAFFNWSSNNQQLVIPNSVTSIGDWVFYDWTSNNKPLVIPSSVTSIGSHAFVNWLLVPYVEIQAITPPTLADRYAFSEQNNAPIYVPDESVDNYKTATNWVDLADRIFPISDKANLMDDIADLQENKQDKLVAGENITIDENTNIISASGGDSNNYININYADLVALRDFNFLKKGAFYQIVDYQTYVRSYEPTNVSFKVNRDGVVHDVSYDYIMSTEHDDIRPIVLEALSNNKLSEEGIQIAGEKIYRVWYDLNNDTSKYLWASETGKGVIYRLIDENGNDVPYDFKSICAYLSNISSNLTDFLPTTNYGPIRLFTNKPGTERTDELPSNPARNNVFKTPKTPYDVYPNAFIATHVAGRPHDNVIDYDGFRHNFISNTTSELGNVIGGFNHNVIERNFHHNLLSNDFHSNKIGKDFNNNSTLESDGYIRGSGFHHNEIGVGFEQNYIRSMYNNTIRNYFTGNTIEKDFHNNKTSTFFRDNVIDQNFYNNNLGISFEQNTIGKNFKNNTIDNVFMKNTIGDDFGTSASMGELAGNKVGIQFMNNIVGKNFAGNTIGNFVGAIAEHPLLSTFKNNFGDNFEFNQVMDGLNAVDLSIPALEGVTRNKIDLSTFNWQIGSTQIWSTGVAGGVVEYYDMINNPGVKQSVVVPTIINLEQP